MDTTTLIEQISHFLFMGGFAIYVWCAYGLVIFTMAINIIWINKREKALIKTIKQNDEGEIISAPQVTFTTAKNPTSSEAEF